MHSKYFTTTCDSIWGEANAYVEHFAIILKLIEYQYLSSFLADHFHIHIYRNQFTTTAGRSGTGIRRHNPERNISGGAGGCVDLLGEKSRPLQGGLVESIGPDGAGIAGPRSDTQCPDQRGARRHANVAPADTATPRIGPGLLYVSDQRQSHEEANRMHRCARYVFKSVRFIDVCRPYS